MPTRILVIGAGPGGYTAAIRAAQLGAEVTIIEKDKIGGTCLNRGCIPSKVMVRTAELLDHMRRAEEFGIENSGNFSVDMEKLMARKESVVKIQADGIRKLLQSHRITCLNGSGFIRSRGLAGVKTADGKEADVAWDKLILAPGTEPLELPSLPFDGKRIISSNDALCLRHVPPNIVVVGGGVIGCELACVFRSFGAKVTIVEAMPRLLPLPSLDEDMSKILQREMKKRKIDLYTDSLAEKTEEAEEKLRISIRPARSDADPARKGVMPVCLDADAVIVCVGRRPLASGLGLEKLGVKTDEHGWILASKRMLTNIRGVYAIGDALGPKKIMLAHAATAEAMVAAENAMGGCKLMSYGKVPAAIFTAPEIASVGLTESQAKMRERDYRASTVLFRSLGKAHAINEIAGQVKMISDASTDKLLGVHIIGHNATELIAEAALAVRSRCRVSDLADTIHAHPTCAEILKEAALKSLSKPLHG